MIRSRYMEIYNTQYTNSLSDRINLSIEYLGTKYSTYHTLHH